MFKFKEIRHKFSLVFIAAVLIFLLMSFLQVYNSTNVDLKSFDGLSKVAKLYFSWLGSLFGNVGKVAGYAIHQNWGVNSSINSSIKWGRMRIRVFIMLFFFLSAFLIISNGNLHMKNPDEAKKFANVYYSWLLGTAGNIFKSTAFVVGFDWLPNKVSETGDFIKNNTNFSAINLSK
jgi:hypothetical protein